MKRITLVNKREITQRQIADKLLDIFETHLGFEEAITKQKLFKRLFKHKYQDNNLADWVRWEFVKKAMNYCRRKSNCFIVGQRTSTGYEYCVVSSVYDAEKYINMLNNSIKKMHYMKKKALKAVEEQWCFEDWSFN